MSYVQQEEITFICIKCKREYSLNDSGSQYGLWQNKILVRCNKCFEQMKHKFWLKVMVEE